MRAKVKAVCLSIEKNDFTKKGTGEVITYRRAKFSVRGTTEVKRLPGTRTGLLWTRPRRAKHQPPA